MRWNTLRHVPRGVTSPYTYPYHLFTRLKELAVANWLGEKFCAPHYLYITGNFGWFFGFKNNDMTYDYW